MNRPRFCIIKPVKKISLPFIFLALLFGACQSASQPRTLTVYAAASLTDAFTEIGAAFEAADPNVTVAFNFGGSQNLRTQIEQGAPADIFASANLKEMDALIAQSLIADGVSQIFLTNQLAVTLPQNNPGNIVSLEDLGKPGIKLVLAAEEVPAGKYARQVLENLNEQFGADFSGRVLANLVSNEDNIRQALAKVQLGEADASIVYVSDAMTAPELKAIEIPAGFNVTAEYPIASLANSTNAETAQAFIDFVLSPEGQTILERWGFTPVNP